MSRKPLPTILPPPRESPVLTDTQLDRFAWAAIALLNINALRLGQKETREESGCLPGVCWECVLTSDLSPEWLRLIAEFDTWAHGARMADVKRVLMFVEARFILAAREQSASVAPPYPPPAQVAEGRAARVEVEGGR